MVFDDFIGYFPILQAEYAQNGIFVILLVELDETVQCFLKHRYVNVPESILAYVEKKAALEQFPDARDNLQIIFTALLLERCEVMFVLVHIFLILVYCCLSMILSKVNYMVLEKLIFLDISHPQCFSNKDKHVGYQYKIFQIQSFSIFFEGVLSCS